MLHTWHIVLFSLLLGYLLLCAFYYFFQEKILFVPAIIPGESNEILIGSTYEDLYLDAGSDSRLHGILIKSASSRGVVVYFHGNTGSMKRWAPIAEELASYGFDIVLPDYRGYGQSTGPRTQQLLYEDAMRWYAHTAETYSEEKICLYGRSLGTAMACYVAGHSSAAALILETPFSSIADAASRHMPIIPVRWLLRFPFENDIWLTRSTAPTLIVHGTKDKLVPYRSARALYQTIKHRANASMVTIPGGKHSNLNSFPLMRAALEKFFDTYFTR